MGGAPAQTRPTRWVEPERVLAEGEQSSLLLEASDERSGRLRLPVGSVAAVVAFLLMIALAVGIAWTGADPDSADANDWLSGFREFIDTLYGGLTLQVLLLMVVLGFGLARLIPARPQGMASAFLNIPYSVLVLVFFGAIFPLQLLFAETVTRYLRRQRQALLEPVLGVALSIPRILGPLRQSCLSATVCLSQHAFNRNWLNSGLRRWRQAAARGAVPVALGQAQAPPRRRRRHWRARQSARHCAPPRARPRSPSCCARAASPW
jgi:hypothetical protein